MSQILGWMGAAAALLLAGCGQDCLELKRMGDFEYSQGNYPNAIRKYEQALKADPACAGVTDKLAEAKARNK